MRKKKTNKKRRITICIAIRRRCLKVLSANLSANLNGLIKSRRAYEMDSGDLVGRGTRNVAILLGDFAGLQRCKSTGVREPLDLHHRSV